MLKGRILSLLCCIVMMCAAALCVNKTLLGHKAETKTKNVPELTDTIATLPDGTQVIHTAVLCNATGYAGSTPLDIYIRDGKISKISSLENGETPNFYEKASNLFGNWQGKTPGQAAELKVDAVSGATYSSEAIKANMTAGLNYYLNTQQQSGIGSLPWKMWVALGVTLAACLLPLFVKSKKYRIVQLIANVVVLGFWCGQFLDYSLMLRYLSNGIELPAGLAAIAMLIAAFIYPLFGHPQYYCNHVCPLGSAQILVSELVPFKIHLSPGLVTFLDWLRKLLWAVLMLLLWADVATDWMNLELFQAFLFKSASWWIIIVAILFVLLSGIISRPYCRFVCPTGSLFKRAENID